MPSNKELRAALIQSRQASSVPARGRIVLVALAVLAATGATAGTVWVTAMAGTSVARPAPSPAVLPGGESTPAPTGSPVTASSAPPAAVAAAPADVGPVEPLLSRAPAGVRWELFLGVAVPLSDSDGPRERRGPVQAAFSRTQVGALLAAAQIGVRRVVTPDVEGLRAVALQQLAPGPGRDAHLRLVAGLRDHNTPAGGYAQYCGFRLLAFTPDVAVISLATRSRQGVLQAETDTLRWSGGDWKLELPPSGLPQPQVLPDLTGYTAWSGVA